MTTVNQPFFTPPGWVFPVVWTILFALMGISAARIYQTAPSKSRSTGLNLFIAQLVVNFFWSLFFFNAQAFGFAFLWLLLLWVLVLLGVVFLLPLLDVTLVGIGNARRKRLDKKKDAAQAVDEKTSDLN